MGYTLTPTELEQLVELRLLIRGELDPSLATHWSGQPADFAGKYYLAYLFLAEAQSTISGSGVSTVKPSADAGSWMWFRGAAKINEGVGPFSLFVREYTATQYNLRTGETIGDMQGVSNTIAENVISDIIQHNGAIPSLQQIGDFDAGAAVGSLYGQSTDFSAWSGVPLFVLMGEPKFFNEHILDQKNGLYDFLALLNSVKEASSSGGSESSLSDIASALLTALQAITSNTSGFSATLTSLGSVLLASLEQFKNSFADSGNLDPSTFAASAITLGKLSAADEIVGLSVAQIIHAGGGDDKVHGSTDTDYIDGGDGEDTLDYSTLGAALSVSYKKSTNETTTAVVNKGVSQGIDRAIQFEKLRLGDQIDDVHIGSGVNLSQVKEIDALGQSGAPGDLVEFSQYGSAISIVDGQVPSGPLLKNFERITLTELGDTFKITTQAYLSELKLIDAAGSGSGKDTLDFSSFPAGVNLVNGVVSGSTIEFKNFEKIIGTDQVDTLDFSAAQTSLEIIANAQNDIVQTGIGNDILDGGSGDDFLDGGAGIDNVVLPSIVGVVTVTKQSASSVPQSLQSNGSSVYAIDFERGAAHETDHLRDIEKITLAGDNHTLSVQPVVTDGGKTLTIDVGSTGTESNDSLSFANYGGPVYLRSGIDAQTGGASQLFIDGKFTKASGLQFQNFNSLILTGHDDYVALSSSGNPYLTTIVAGAGSDTVDARGVVNAYIDLGVGSDVLRHAERGSIVHVGDDADKDTVVFSAQTYIDGLRSDDVIVSSAGKALHGALGQLGQESAWVTDPIRNIAYGFNILGDVVVRDVTSNQSMFLAGLSDKVGPETPAENRAAGIIVAMESWGASRLLDMEITVSENNNNIFKIANARYEVQTGKSYFKNVDPLILDLDGDGVHLRPVNPGSPMVDMHFTGFAVKTGWTLPGDGILVHDKNSDNNVDDVRELLGGPGPNGFAALEAEDGNSDDVIDATDSVFAELKVWEDADGDGQVDAGELKSLNDAGIASISLTTTPQSGVTNAGNSITATGSFTRADSTTSAIAEVGFATDPFHSEYLGDKTVSVEAALRANLKGYGTLTDLHVAMTLDPDLIDVVDIQLPNLNVVDLAALRDASMPILTAWTLAVPLLDANGDPVSINPATGHANIPIRVSMEASGVTTVHDFAYEFTDANNHTYWKLASGGDVLDGNGDPIAQPTYEDVLAQSAVSGEWDILTPAQLGFIERYLGHELPLDQSPDHPTAQLDVMSDFLTGVMQILNVQAVRLAMQGPLSSYFSGIAYDVVADKFSATTDDQLTPMYEAIFAAAPPSTNGATEWLENWSSIIRVVLNDFVRDEDRTLTYGYQFACMVPAFETVGLPLSLQVAAEALGILSNLILEGSGTTFQGTSDSDILYVTAEEQTVTGGSGLDNYVFGADFGNIVINDHEAALTQQSPDIIRFTSHHSDDFIASRDGLDLVLSVIGTSQVVRVVGQFTGVKPGLIGGNLNTDSGVREIVFADGTIWGPVEIAFAASHPLETNDNLVGTFATDVLDGGEGDDTLSGGDNGDIYLFDIGYGNDTVHDQQTYILADGQDVVRFGPGIEASDVSFHRFGETNDLVVQIEGSADTLTIQGQFDSAYPAVFDQIWLNRIEVFAFDDGQSYSWEDIILKLNATRGTSGNDIIYGFDYEDVLDGRGGDDFLSGSNENDTYLFGKGYGHDVIFDDTWNPLSGMTDTVVFNDDVLPSDVTFRRDGNSEDLVIELSTGDTLTIQDQFFRALTLSLWFSRIENFVFTSTNETIGFEEVMQRLLDQASTIGNDEIFGFAREDILDGGTGDDYLAGYLDGDTYIWAAGYGNDSIYDYGDLISHGDNIDVVEMGEGIAPEDITLTRIDGGDDLVLTNTVTGETLTLQDHFTFGDGTVFHFMQLEEIRFADETVWTPDYLRIHTILGEQTSGDDNVYGFDTADILDGGAGNDTLRGNGGGDTYVFGLGYGVDTVDAWLHTVYRDYPDRILFKSDIASSDIELSRSGDGLIVDIAGTSDQLVIKYAFSASGLYSVESFEFSTGEIWTEQQIMNRFYGGDGTNVATSGNDLIVGTVGTDVLDGLAGDDILIGRDGVDTYKIYQGGGNDTIVDNSIYGNPDDLIELVGLNATDVQLSRTGSDLQIKILASGEITTVQDQFASVAHGVERIQFANGVIWDKDDIAERAWIRGTSGADVLTGGSANETLHGAAGNDTLAGGAGSDTYIYASGDGSDLIQENGTSLNIDSLKFTNLNLADVTWGHSTVDSNDLLITINATGETITVDDHLISVAKGLEQIEFADSTVMNRTDIANGTIIPITGTSGNDVLGGTSAPNTFDGLGGDDTLTGYDAGDTYIFGAGSGNDTIVESWIYSGTDIVRFVGLNVADLLFSRVGNNAVIKIVSAGETLTVVDQFISGSGVERLVFADNTIWDRNQIQAASWIRGTGADETIAGSTIDDTIDGGAGNDTLTGSQGNDTYIYGTEYGNDTIDDEKWSYTGTDTVRFVDLDSADVLFSRVGDNAVVKILSSGETLTINDQFFSTSGADQILFADSTIWNRADIQAASWIRGTIAGEIINGTGSADTVDPGAGNDTINGSESGDTYIYGSGYGNDVLNSEESYFAGTDQLKLIDLNIADLTFSKVGNSLVMKVNATGETFTVTDQFVSTRGIEQIIFADSTVWSRAQISEASWIWGTSGNDTISSSSADDVIDGGAGNDTITDLGGNDTYIYGVGSGNDTITEYYYNAGTDKVRLVGLNASDVRFSRVSNNLVITVLASGETLTVTNQFTSTNGIDQIIFADTSSWDRDQIKAESWIRGTSGNDTISGSSADDIIDGGAGNDTITDPGGSDTYIFGVGSGNDSITENYYNSGTDTLKLVGLNAADVTFAKSGNNLVLTINASGEALTVVNQFTSTNGIDQILFADATIWDRTQIADASWIRGTSGGETLVGTSGNDIIDGGGGADTLQGGGGGDTYIYGPGSGNDVVSESSTSGTDAVKFIGLNLTDLALSRSGSNAIVTIISSGETLTITGQFGSGGVEQFVFADTTVWDRNQISAGFWIVGTSSGETLTGTSGNDTIDGAGGNDTVRGSSGSDTYVYRSADGTDYIDDESGSNAEIDTVWLMDLMPSDITLTRSGMHAVVTVTGTGQTITFDEQYWSATANWGLDQIRFSDDTLWNRDQIMQNVWWYGTGGNDSISGWASFDNINGGAGNDTINGNAGIDRLDGGANNDTIAGGTESDTFIFRAGFGNDTITDFVAGASTDDVIEFHDGIFADFTAVMAAASASGSDTIITDGSNTITLQNVALASLHQDDFRFV